MILCNLDSGITSSKKVTVVRQLFRNEGIPLAEITGQNGFIDFQGRLLHALVCGGFEFSNSIQAYSEKSPAGEISEGASLSGQKWRVGDAGKDGVFDFKNGLLVGPQEKAFAYVAMWIKSSKPLNDLLSEPNLPKLSFTYGSDDGCELWLNEELLAKHERHGPLDPSMFSQSPLLLKLGWNQLVIKVVQESGEWKFSGKFTCSDVSFLSKLEFGKENPARGK